MNSKEYKRNLEENTLDGEHLSSSGKIKQQRFTDIEDVNEVLDTFQSKCGV